MEKKSKRSFLREQDKHFLASLYVATAVIFAWKGLWEGIYEIPYIGDPFVFLFVGFAMLTFSGMIFKEFDPMGGVEKAVQKKLEEIIDHPQKNSFKLIYFDKFKNKEVIIDAKKMYKVEKNTLIIKENGSEIFVPFNRIKYINFKGIEYWKL